MKRLVSLLIVPTIALSGLAATATAQVPNQMQYQGYLTDEGGNPLDTTLDMVFVIYNDSIGPGTVWTETHVDVTVEDGVFEVILGSVSGVTGDVVNDSVRWLGITVGDDSEIHPRTKLVTVPYAFRVGTVDGATGGTISGDVIIQSDLDLDGDLRATGKATVGPDHTNTGGSAFVAGQENTASADYATVSGGFFNRATNSSATIGGGTDNLAQGASSTVAGGEGNTASGIKSAVGGGQSNTASGQYGTVSGGNGNIAGSSRAAVCGGSGNTAAGGWSFIGGGVNNMAAGNEGAIGGGGWNVVEGDYSTIPGGYADTISATADYSYLFGIGSRLTQDSTFMVDMPHIWFGNEVTGYEFPENRGTSGQVMQTDGSGQLSWVEMSGSGAGGGWVDDGTVVRLETAGDSVGIGITDPAEKLHVAGDIRLNAGGDIAFADDNTRVYESVDDLYLTADDDIYLRPDDDIYIRYDGAASDFVRIDPAAKEIGIGTTSPTEMLHVENSASAGRAFLKLETSHATNYDEVGIRFQTPVNMWHFRMDDDTHANLPDTGSLALRSQNSGIEVMTWTDDGHVGVGTTRPTEELDVDGTILGAMPLTAVGIATDGTYYATILVAAIPSSGKVYVRTPNSGIQIGSLDNSGYYGSWADFGTPDASSRIVGVGASLEYSGSASYYASVITVRMSSGDVYVRIPNSNSNIGVLDDPGYYGSWVNFGNPGL